MSTNPSIVLAGGGTAGHLFPGLAVARQLVADGCDLPLVFAGTGRTFEAERVAEAGFEYLPLPCSPSPRRARDAWRFLADNMRGYYRALRFLRERRVELVVGLGGYGSVPMVQAALRRRVPYILLEQNAVAGRATRWLARGAQEVCLALADASVQLPRCPVRLTGNPVRRAFVHLAELRRRGRLPAVQRPRLLVLGGSGGARALNEQVPLAVYKASAALAGWEIIHQSGERDTAETSALYSKLAIGARVVPFIHGLAQTLAETTLVISRAGGTTIAELACAAVPTIFVPYPDAADDHQRRNAQCLGASGAAIVVDGRDSDTRLDDLLARQITHLAAEPLLRERMSAALDRCARPEASRLVCRSILGALRPRLAATG